MDEYVKMIYDRSVSEINVLPSENEIETNRRRIGYLNIRFFMQTLLNRMDRTSMFSGLEARVPFADRTLVDYVFNIPWEMKAKDGLVKNILRRIKRTFAGRNFVPSQKPLSKNIQSLLRKFIGKTPQGGTFRLCKSPAFSPKFKAGQPVFR